MAEIYFDSAATTPVRKEVVAAMQPFYNELFANPASSHLAGQRAAGKLEDAREKIADFLGAAKAEEIVFTAGGTEADNLALKGVALAYQNQGKHIITSAIEHHAVLNSCKFLEKYLGFEVTYLPVDENGFVSPADLKSAIRPDTILISIMLANNEIGTIQPIQKLADLASRDNILFHTDAVQAAGQLKFNVKELGVDLLTIAGHKFNGPKGVGALYIRKGVKLVPQMSGGTQERKRRAGTVNLPAVIGMAKAAELLQNELTAKIKYLTELSQYFLAELEKLAVLTEIKLNGPEPGSNRLPANISLSFKELAGEAILFNLSLKNVAAAAGSACASGSLSLSHVLEAIGLKPAFAEGTIRFSLSKNNNKKDIDFLVKELATIIKRLKDLNNI